MHIYIYIYTLYIHYIYIYIHASLFHVADEDTTQRGCLFDSVDFISLCKLKFLAYLLNVMKPFVMCIISYAQCCVLHTYVSIAFGNGRSLPQLFRCVA
jgi:hypothetical protein